jgi:hypothetical protein
MGKDMASSFCIHLGYIFFHSARGALCIYIPGEGERGIIFCGHTILSIHPHREFNPASMASHGVPVDWASLPNDLVSKISDIFLSMDKLDYYANFRAICGGWRGAL